MRYATHSKAVWDVISVVVAATLAAAFLLWATQAAGVVPTQETVICPWEGVFSTKEYPGALPLIEVGDPVEPQTIVGLVYPNFLNPNGRFEVYAGVHGTVVEVLVEDGTFVKAGSPLMIVELDPIEAH